MLNTPWAVWLQMIGDLAISTGETGKEAAMDALDLAARYPFRAGVSKTIVLLTCESCSENLVSYADMAELLIKRDIKLHLITPHDFRMKSNSPKASNIWGRHTQYSGNFCFITFAASQYQTCNVTVMYTEA